LAKNKHFCFDVVRFYCSVHFCSAFTFRALPLIIRHKKKPCITTTQIQRLLIYASQGILGAIRYEALIGRKNLMSLIDRFDSQAIIKITILMMALPWLHFFCISDNKLNKSGP